MVIELNMNGNVEEKLEKLKKKAKQDGMEFSGTYPDGTFEVPEYGISGNYSITGDTISMTGFPGLFEGMAKKRLKKTIDSL